MKTNIRKIIYDPDIKMEWWKWNETCDRCGKDTGMSALMHSEKPNTDECDFCLDCLRYLMDNNISLEAADKKYKKITVN